MALILYHIGRFSPHRIYPLSHFFGTVDIFRGSDVCLLHWLQIRSWLERSLPKVNSFLPKPRKPLCISAKG